MRDRLLGQIKDFLTVHWQKGLPLLVACSGGPDSKALLYLLLDCQTFFDLEIQVVHVDHGWRPESSTQAQALKKEVEGLGLTFHLQSLKGLPLKENVAREARYDFLQQVAAATRSQAILLGHQREDQGETILKRILEGASLPACGGMRAVTQLGQVNLWRPLLAISKKELIQWLKQRGISYFQDETNLNPQYLRGRFRTSIVPFLEKSFGKSIVKNLCRLGERAQKIELYLRKQVEPLWQMIENSTICLSLLKDLDDVILDYFLKEWTKREEIDLSIQQLTLLLRMVRQPNSGAVLQTPTHRLEVKQGKLALKRLNNYLNR